MDSLSVRENIMLPKILDKKSAKECMEESQKYAEQFGITHLMNKKPYELSGGEKQRVAISRALINNPDLILADEPTGNLDSKSGDVVIHTLSHINRELGKTIVMVTHDPKMASYCSRLILLKDEGVVGSSQKISISRNCIENKNQACYSSGTQINSSICNVSIFINSFTSSLDIRALIKNENHRKQINTCLIKKVVHIYWYIYIKCML